MKGGDDAMEDYQKGNGLRGFLRMLCFMVFGVLAFTNPLDLYNPYNIGFGVIAGLLFGFLCRLFLVWLLGAFNPQVKQSHGRKAISTAVSRSMLFLLPFAVMAFVSFYYLGWYITSGFLSAGIMSAAASAAIEIGKLKQKQEIKNMVVTSLVAAAFSALWIFGTGFVAGVPGLIEGVAEFIRSQTGNLF
jgi:hypothetical protein